jgi:hypothetical protein
LGSIQVAHPLAIGSVNKGKYRHLDSEPVRGTAVSSAVQCSDVALCDAIVGVTSQTHHYRDSARGASEIEREDVMFSDDDEQGSHQDTKNEYSAWYNYDDINNRSSVR